MYARGQALASALGTIMLVQPLFEKGGGKGEALVMLSTQKMHPAQKFPPKNKIDKMFTPVGIGILWILGRWVVFFCVVLIKV